jgi:hypothetical protein
MEFILHSSYFSENKRFRIDTGLLPRDQFEPRIHLHPPSPNLVLCLEENQWYELFFTHSFGIDQFFTGNWDIPPIYHLPNPPDNSEVVGGFRLGQYLWQFSEMCMESGVKNRLLTVKFDDCNNLFMSPLRLIQEQVNQTATIRLSSDCWEFLKTVKDAVSLRFSFLHYYKFFAKAYYATLINYGIRNNTKWMEVISVNHNNLPQGPIPCSLASNELDFNIFTLIQAEIRQLPLSAQFEKDVGVGRRNRRCATINRTATGLTDHYYYETHWWFFDPITIDDKRVLFDNLLYNNQQQK